MPSPKDRRIEITHQLVGIDLFRRDSLLRSIGEQCSSMNIRGGESTALQALELPLPFVVGRIEIISWDALLLVFDHNRRDTMQEGIHRQEKNLKSIETRMTCRSSLL